MSAEIIKLVPNEIGEGYVLRSEDVLTAALDYKFGRMVIVGELEDGELYIAGTANAGESVILMEQAKMDIIGR